MRKIAFFTLVLAISVTGHAQEVYEMTGSFEDTSHHIHQTDHKIQEQQDDISMGTFKDQQVKRVPANYETEIEIESEHINEITGTFE